MCNIEFQRGEGKRQNKEKDEVRFIKRVSRLKDVSNLDTYEITLQ